MLKYSSTIIMLMAIMGCDKVEEGSDVTKKESINMPPIENNDNEENSKNINLDLTLPDNPYVGSGEEDFSTPKLLPNLFDIKKKEKKIKVGGKLLEDPSNPDSVKSIEGAEVSIEIKME